MAFDITLSPATSDFFISPGNSYTKAFNITNNSESLVILNSSVEAWQPKGNDGSVVYTSKFTDNSVIFSLNNSDLILGQPFVIKPKETRQLVLKIATSKSTLIKDHYYTFFVTQQSEFQNNAKIGAHLIFSTQKPSNISLKIKEFKISPLIKDCLLKPIYFTGLIENNNLLYSKIIGKLNISKNNLTIKEYTLSPDTVLASNKRTIRCINDKAEVIPCALNTPLWPGVYKTTISLDQEKPVSFETGFVVFPYSIVFVILITISVLFFYRRLFHRP